MKRVLYLLPVFILTISYFCISAGFQHHRLSYDINGAIQTDQKVILYTSAGILLTSEDRGANWAPETTFPDSVDIRKIIPVDNGFVGIARCGLILTADSDAENWEVRKVDTISYIDIILYENDLYILARSFNGGHKILSVNTEFETKVEAEFENGYWGKALFSFGAYLISSSSTNMYTVDIGNDFNIVRYDSVVLGNTFTIRAVLDGTIYATAFDTSYTYTENNGKNLETKNRNCSSLYSSTSPDSGWMKMNVLAELTAINNNKLYTLTAKKSGKNSCCPEFCVYQDEQFQQISSDDKHIYGNPIGRSLYFVDEDNILSVGTNNTIIHSGDGGASWQLCSFFPNSIYFGSFLHSGTTDSTCYYIYDNQIYHYDKARKMMVAAIDMSDTIVGRFDMFDHFNTCPDGRGFAFAGGQKYVNGNFYPPFVNTIYTDDSWQTYKSKEVSDFAMLSSFYSPYFSVYLDDGLVLAYSVGNASSAMYSIIICLDNEYNVIEKKKIDLFSIQNMKLIDGKIYAFGEDLSYTESQEADAWSKAIVYSSSDCGLTWNSVIEYEMPKPCNPEITLWDGKEIFFGHQENNIRFLHQYCIDLSNNSAYELDQSSDSLRTIIFKSGDYLYAKTMKYRFVRSKNYSSASASWEEADLNIVNNWNIYDKAWDNDKSFCLAIYNASEFYYFIYNKNDTSSIEEQIVYANGLDAGPLHPNPARSQARATIYNAPGWDLASVRATVYNALGDNCSDKCNVRIVPSANNQGELYFDCIGLPQGMYFIKLQSRGHSHTMAVVVSR